MDLADELPGSNSIEDNEMDRVIIDTSYNWLSRKDKYTSEQLSDMVGWIDRQVSLDKDSLVGNNCPIVLPEQLNKHQLFVYNIVSEFLLNDKQLFMMVLGTAGTGKTFTICALSYLIKHFVKRCAPTAKAACLINGETLHRLFHIQVDFKDGQKYIEIKNQQLVDLQTTFASITHVIIDEFSMMSQTMLGKIDGRLRQAKCKPDSLFGGFSIILTGDPAQLFPVGGAPLYDKPSIKSIVNC
jgi:hypothetical protein